MANDRDEGSGEDRAIPLKDEGLERTQAGATLDSAQSRPGTARLAPGDAPPSIGSYRILGKLGEGGMGVVYEAEQRDPKRIVALKVIRGGAFVDDRRVRMFEREVETLARLTHPNIGAIYESGRTEDGRHFFAMELVRGQTLDVYVASRGPATEPGELEHRLRLFAKVASAVHHAHQRGVIHRDLKPSNVVVTSAADVGATASNPAVPEVKILDFGLARITDEDVRAASIVTDVGVIKGTLAYMSPEQARGDTAAVDVRTDVYALGVVLYEMIAGQRPYDVGRASIVEAVRVICDEPPRSLRTTLSGGRRLDADLETVLGKALEKDPERRYASAAALADDVGRFLVAEAILARPPSAAYQMRKFAQRHRPMVVGAGTAVLALVAGIVVSTSLYFRAERAAERARIDAATARQVGHFLEDMLAGAGPSVAQGRDATLLREILERASKRIDEELIDAPEIEARLRSTLGATYTELNDFEEAEKQFGRALTVYQELFGDESADLAATESSLGLLESKRGNHDAAVEHFERAIEIAGRVHGEADAKTGEYLMNLGNAYAENGKYQEALEYLEQALPILRGAEGGDENLGTVSNSIGNVQHHLGNFDEAEKGYSAGLEIHRRVLGESHPFVATDLSNLAALAESRGDLAAAEKRYREVIEIERKLHPEGDYAIVIPLTGLARVLEKGGRFDEAEALLDEGLDLARRIFGEKSGQVVRQLNQLGTLRDAKGDLRGAVEAYETALATSREIFDSRNEQIGSGLNNVAMARSALGDHDSAIRMLEEALEIHAAATGADGPNATLVRNNLGRAYREAGKLDEAEVMFRDVLARRIRTVGESHFSTAVTMNDLSRVLQEQKRTGEAVEIARKAVEVFRASSGPDHFQTMKVETVFGEALRKDGKLEEAETLLRGTLARQVAAAGDESDRALEAGAFLADVLAAAGKRDEAESLYRKAIDAPPEKLGPRRRARFLRSYGERLTEWERFEEAREALEESYRVWIEMASPRSRGACDTAAALVTLFERWPGHERDVATWRPKSRGQP